MGCTPSKSTVLYSQDNVCWDLDTCSTFVSSVRSSESSPERPRNVVDVGMQTYLSVPCRDVHGRLVSQSSNPECSADSSAPSSSHCAGQLSSKPDSPTLNRPTDTEGSGTA